MAAGNEQVFYSDGNTLVTSARLVLPNGGTRTISPQRVESVHIRDYKDSNGCMLMIMLPLYLLALIGVVGGGIGVLMGLMGLVGFDDEYDWKTSLIGLGVMAGGLVAGIVGHRIGGARERDKSEIILGITGETEPLHCCNSLDKEKVLTIATAINAARNV